MPLGESRKSQRTTGQFQIQRLVWLAKNFIGFLKASCEEHT